MPLKQIPQNNNNKFLLPQHLKQILHRSNDAESLRCPPVSRESIDRQPRKQNSLPDIISSSQSPLSPSKLSIVQPIRHESKYQEFKKHINEQKQNECDMFQRIDVNAKHIDAISTFQQIQYDTEQENIQIKRGRQQQVQHSAPVYQLMNDPKYIEKLK